MTQTLAPVIPTKVERISSKINESTAGEMVVSSASGGIAFRSMLEVMEFAKMMAVSDIGVRKHLRGNAGACLSVTLQAVEWRMSPFAVANKSYLVNDQISYESQLIHAVIEQRAPIKGRLRHRFVGEREKRKCIVWATPRDGGEDLEYMSPEIGNIKPKNSPLWATKPDLQLFYNTSRDWARIYFPDVLLGVYAEDELRDSPVPAETPRVSRADRLNAALAAPAADTAADVEPVVDQAVAEDSQLEADVHQTPEEEPPPADDAQQAPPEEAPTGDEALMIAMDEAMEGPEWKAALMKLATDRGLEPAEAEARIAKFEKLHAKRGEVLSLVNRKLLMVAVLHDRLQANGSIAK